MALSRDKQEQHPFKIRTGLRPNRGMVWIGSNLKDHLIPSPLPWAGIIDQERDSLLVGLRDISGTARPRLSSVLAKPWQKGWIGGIFKAGSLSFIQPCRRQGKHPISVKSGWIQNLLGFMG